MADVDILLIDDDRELLDIEAELLRVYNFTVETKTSGAEALDFLEKSQPRCVICDVVMPHMSGIQFFKKLVANNRLNFPFVMLTGFGIDDDIVNQKIKEGQVKLFFKPTSVQEVAKYIKSKL